MLITLHPASLAPCHRDRITSVWVRSGGKLPKNDVVNSESNTNVHIAPKEIVVCTEILSKLLKRILASRLRIASEPK